LSPSIYIVTCLTEGNDRIRDTAGNRDIFAPFLVTVTIGLYGCEANNGLWGYVATGELALEVSRLQLVVEVRRRRSAVPSARTDKLPVL
jgi:hypothetical protein